MNQEGQTGTRSHMPLHALWEQEKGGILPEQVSEVFQKIRQKKYLIHMLPNGVSAALCGDGLSALGARPLMAVAPEEMEEIVPQVDGCVVNLGQLNQEKIRAVRLAMECAATKEKPLVVDPVGCGASIFRLQAVQELMKIPWKGIIKGNRSEIYSIQQGKLTKEGIDSFKKHRLTDQLRPGSVYFITGEPDCILWEGGGVVISHESPIQQNIVGSGCLAGAVTGACSSAVYEIHGVDGEWMKLAAASASLGMAFVLEYARRKKGYGEVKTALLDGLCLLSETCFLDWLKVKANSSMKGV